MALLRRARARYVTLEASFACRTCSPTSLLPYSRSSPCGLVARLPSVCTTWLLSLSGPWSRGFSSSFWTLSLPTPGGGPRALLPPLPRSLRAVSPSRWCLFALRLVRCFRSFTFPLLTGVFTLLRLCVLRLAPSSFSLLVCAFPLSSAWVGPCPPSFVPRLGSLRAQTFCPSRSLVDPALLLRVFPLVSWVLRCLLFLLAVFVFFSPLSPTLSLSWAFFLSFSSAPPALRVPPVPCGCCRGFVRLLRFCPVLHAFAWLSFFFGRFPRPLPV